MSIVTILDRWLFRGGLAAAIAALNEVPLAREAILETDRGRLKAGNGSDNYNDLLYVNLGFVDFATLANGYVPVYDSANDKWTFAAPTSISATAGMQVGHAKTTSATTATVTAVIPADNTIPQNTEGAAFASLDTTITPKDGANLLVVVVDFPTIAIGPSADGVTVALFRDSGADAIAVGHITIPNNTFRAQMRVVAIVAAGSTSSTTFKARIGVQDSGWTAYVNRGSAGSLFNGMLIASMEIREIKL